MLPQVCQESTGSQGRAGQGHTWSQKADALGLAWGGKDREARGELSCSPSPGPQASAEGWGHPASQHTGLSVSSCMSAVLTWAPGKALSHIHQDLVKTMWNRRREQGRREMSVQGLAHPP